MRFWLLFSIFLFSFPTIAQVTWEMPIELSQGKGERGPWQQNESHYRYVDDPTILFHVDHTISTAWVDQEKKDVFFQKISPGGQKIGKPINISKNPKTFSWLPRLGTSPKDPKKIFVLWQEIIFSGGSHGGDILFASSANGGQSFSKPINLSKSIGGDGKGRINQEIWHNGSYDLGMGPDGSVFVVWTEFDGWLWLSRSEDHGKTFSHPFRLNEKRNPKLARAPTIAIGADKTVYIAFTSGEDPSADIQLIISKDQGKAFSDPRPIFQTKNYSDAPQLWMASDNALHLVFAESSGGPFETFEIRHTRSFNQGRTFEAAKVISDPSSFPSESSHFPSIAGGNHGRVYIVWEIHPKKNERPYGLALSLSQDQGKTFSPGALVPASQDPSGARNGSYQGLLMEKLAVHPEGDSFAIINSSLKLNEKSRVWMVKGKRAQLKSAKPEKLHFEMAALDENRK